MLTLVDSGCETHQERQFHLEGLSTLLITGLVCSLPQEGLYHTYTCDHGKSHHLSYRIHKESEVHDFPEFCCLEAGDWRAALSSGEEFGYSGRA